MAQTENGVGVSYKLTDGTMVWVRRDTWAEVREDIGLMFGEEAFPRLESQLQRAWGGFKATVHVAEDPLSEEEAVQTLKDELGATEHQASFESCKRCGATKDRWVPPGVSKKTGKSYPGFYGCPTSGCPGR